MAYFQASLPSCAHSWQHVLHGEQPGPIDCELVLLLQKVRLTAKTEAPGDLVLLANLPELDVAAE